MTGSASNHSNPAMTLIASLKTFITLRPFSKHEHTEPIECYFVSTFLYLLLLVRE
jgi:hypothetical protein